MLSCRLPSLSCFESYFVLKALATAAAGEQSLYLIHRHWSAMLELGATTTWERFDPQWADANVLAHDFPPVNAMNQDTSMAHPWVGSCLPCPSLFVRLLLTLFPIVHCFVHHVGGLHSGQYAGSFVLRPPCGRVVLLPPFSPLAHVGGSWVGHFKYVFILRRKLERA
jgi:hypothetical protein